MTPSDQLKQVEGQWDEVVRLCDQFTGRRVRITVLSDERAAAPSMGHVIKRWLAEGDALVAAAPANEESNVFGKALVEKFRKQGLVL